MSGGAGWSRTNKSGFAIRSIPLCYRAMVVTLSARACARKPVNEVDPVPGCDGSRQYGPVETQHAPLTGFLLLTSHSCLFATPTAASAHDCHVALAVRIAPRPVSH